MRLAWSGLSIRNRVLMWVRPPRHRERMSEQMFEDLVTAAYDMQRNGVAMSAAAFAALSPASREAWRIVYVERENDERMWRVAEQKNAQLAAMTALKINDPMRAVEMMMEWVDE